MRLVPAVVTPDVIKALERVKAKTGDRWTVPFVLSCIEKGFAGLYAIMDSDSRIAWLVVERMDQGEVWMNVWIMEGKGLERGREVYPLIDDLARSIGASRWRCTGREGWGRACDWLKPVAVVYERELP